MMVSPGFLMGICVLVGVFPAFFAGPLVNAAAKSILGPDMPVYHLAVWHGFNLALGLSLIAMAGGGICYWQRHRLFDAHQWCTRYLDGKTLFETLISRLIHASRWITQLIENRSFQRYAALLIGSTLILGISPFLTATTSFLGSESLTPLDPVSLVMGLILISAAIATVITHHHRILSIVMLSTVGLVVALAFTRFSAPDLALTQISVEVVTIILMMMALHLLPRYTPRESSWIRKWRDLFCPCWPVAVRPPC